MADPTTLEDAARSWHRAAARERQLRAVRDLTILTAHREGVGVRELARRAGIDPTQVSRILRRGE